MTNWVHTSTVSDKAATWVEDKNKPDKSSWISSNRGNDINNFWFKAHNSEVIGTNLIQLALSNNQMQMTNYSSGVLYYQKVIEVVPEGDYTAGFEIDYVSITDIDGGSTLNPVIYLGVLTNTAAYGSIYTGPGTDLNKGFTARNEATGGQYLLLSFGISARDMIVWDNVSLTGPLPSDPSTTGDLISPYGDFNDSPTDFVQSDVTSTPAWSNQLWNQGYAKNFSKVAGGIGYSVNDIVYAVNPQGTSSEDNASFRVTSLQGAGEDGIVLGLTILTRGDKYITNDLCQTTTDEGGSYLTIRIDEVTNTYTSTPLSATWITS